MYTTLLSKNSSTGSTSSNANGHSIFSPTCEVNTSGEYLNKTNHMTFTNQRRIPIKIILNDDEEVISQENNSDTTEENSLHNFYLASNSNLKEFKDFKRKKFVIQY